MTSNIVTENQAGNSTPQIATTAAVDVAAWPTFEEVLEQIHLRRWLSRYLAGVDDATGWKINPDCVDRFLDDLQGTTYSRITPHDDDKWMSFIHQVVTDQRNACPEANIPPSSVVTFERGEGTYVRGELIVCLASAPGGSFFDLKIAPDTKDAVGMNSEQLDALGMVIAVDVPAPSSR